MKYSDDDIDHFKNESVFSVPLVSPFGENESWWIVQMTKHLLMISLHFTHASPTESVRKLWVLWMVGFVDMTAVAK